MRARWLAWIWLVGCSDPQPRVAGLDDDTGLDDTALGTDGSLDGATSADDVDSTSAPDPGADTTADDDTTGDPPEPPDGPQVYPADRTHSPVSAEVAAGWRDLAATRPEHFDDVFMKAGASSTVNVHTLYCFADPAQVDLAGHAALEPSWTWFAGGDAAGTTPFDRETLAAQSGRTAGWAITGDPSPLQAELDALSPRIALVHYGTNDMGFGATYEGALAGFYANMSELCDTLQAQGVLPVLFGITRRADDPFAQEWVPTFNAAVRGLAQQRQIPFVDLFHAIDPLPGSGLSGDGLHLEAYEGGACILSTEGLEHGYNVRNLVALEALDRVRRVLDDGAEGLEPPLPPRAGTGAAEDPIEIDALPFADARDTTRDGAALVDGYPGCSDSDESGPEVWYRLSLAGPQRLRIVVLDRAGVDVDVHLLGDGADPQLDCLDRDDRIIRADLAAGDYWVVVDTWAGATGPLSGAYLLVVTPCADDDLDCTPS